jgi:hypothetical protein
MCATNEVGVEEIRRWIAGQFRVRPESVRCHDGKWSVYFGAIVVHRDYSTDTRAWNPISHEVIARAIREIRHERE